MAASLRSLVERARGGTGLVIVEFTAVHARHGLGEERQLRLEDRAR